MTTSLQQLSFLLMGSWLLLLLPCATSFLTVLPVQTSFHQHHSPFSSALRIPRISSHVATSARKRRNSDRIIDSSWSPTTTITTTQSSSLLLPVDAFPLSTTSTTSTPLNPSRTNDKSNDKSQPSLVPRSQLVTSLVLATNAGLVNGLCLLSSTTNSAIGTTQAVAAVTSTWTNAALAAHTGNVSQLVWLAAVILSYMGGSALVGYAWNNPTDNSNHQQQPHPLSLPNSLLTVAAGLLLVASRLLGAGYRMGFLCCAAAMGLQNALSSLTTGNLCRTSHMSGMTSDMGTLLGQWLRHGGRINPKLRLFATLTASFGVGGYTAAVVAPVWRTASLVWPAAVYMGIVMVQHAYHQYSNTIVYEPLVLAWKQFVQVGQRLTRHPQQALSSV